MTPETSFFVRVGHDDAGKYTPAQVYGALADGSLPDTAEFSLDGRAWKPIAEMDLISTLPVPPAFPQSDPKPVFPPMVNQAEFQAMIQNLPRIIAIGVERGIWRFAIAYTILCLLLGVLFLVLQTAF